MSRLLVPPEAVGQRLDLFLSTQRQDLSRSRLQDLIREGHITLNSASTKPSAKLRSGDAIDITVPDLRPAATEPEAIDLAVLFEDEHLLVLNKPAGMVVHPAAGNWSGTLVNALLHHCDDLSGIGGEERPGIVHRLDKDTTGCIAVAKNDASHQELSRQFAGREVEKIYLALAAGPFAKREGAVEAPIGRHPVHRKKMTVLPAGRPSKTGWRVLGEIEAPEAPRSVGTVVECTLFTGRTHQIRVHLKHLGHPLLGDEIYGRKLGFERQMLHSWKLSFTHPTTGERIACQAPLPEDFRAAGVKI